MELLEHIDLNSINTIKSKEKIGINTIKKNREY